jgi:hypothetical protein
MSVVLPCIEEVSAVRIHMAQDLRPNDARLAVARSLREVERRFDNKVSLFLRLHAGYVGSF